MTIAPIHRDTRTAGQAALRIAERLRAEGRNVRIIYRRNKREASL